MEDLNINVIKGFKIKVKSIKKEKSTYVINTDNGVKVIKKSQSTANGLIFQNEIKKHLFENGFKNTDMYYLSVQEKPFFEFNNENYIMTDYVEGKNVNFSNKDDFKRTLVTLGRMHSILKKIDIKEDLKLYRKNNLTEMYSKKLTEIMMLKKRVKKQSKLSDFDVIFLKNYDYYTENLKKAQNLLNQVNFDLISDNAIKKNEICHNTLKEEYLIDSAKQEDIVVTNFSESLIDACIVDLSDIIKRYIKCLDNNNNGNYMSISEILTVYTSENTLSENEIDAIFPLLIYPGKFIKICSQYYAKKRSWVPSALNTRINSIIEKKQVEKDFIEAFYPR